MKLEKCPFCGGEEINLCTRDGVMRYYWYECTKCYCGTGHEESENEARSAWNRRADHIRDTTEKVSNADRIRSMSDEELARWLVDATVCERVCNEDEYCHGNECIERLTSWLQQPAKEE